MCGQSPQFCKIAHVLMAEKDHATYMMAPQDLNKLVRWSLPTLKCHEKLLSDRLFKLHGILCVPRRTRNSGAVYVSPLANAFGSLAWGWHAPPPMAMHRAIIR